MTPPFAIDEPQKATRKKPYGWLFLIMAATAVLFLFFLRLPVTPTVSAFCGKACHSMNPAWQSWRRSSHANNACMSCHGGSSKTEQFVKMLKFSWRDITQEASGAYRPIKVSERHQVADTICRSCHQPKPRAQSNGRIMDHQAHARIKLRCRDCHNRGPHRDARKYAPLAKLKKVDGYQDYMTMRAGCWRCHKKGGKFTAANGKKFIGPFQSGAAVASTDCQSCHAGFEAALLNKNIEKVWLRHVKQPPWKNGVVHGQMARETKFKPCKTCHRPKERCTVCHKGVTMPHAENWIVARNHGAAAKATKGEPCQMCHKLKEVPGCTAKGHHHEEWVVGKKLDLEKNPWSSGFKSHGPAALATNARLCKRCHDQSTWCTTQCHRGITMPHAPNWRQIHFTVVGYKPGAGWQPKPTPCDLCHNPNGKDPVFCITCHHKEFAPANKAGPGGLMALAGSRYGVRRDLEGGIGPCAKCHAVRFCWRCHENL